MEKLDRLVWATGISVQLFGLQVGIRVSTPELLDRALDCLPHGWKPSSSTTVERLYSFISGHPPQRKGIRAFHLAYAEVEKIARTQSLDEMYNAFESHLGVFLAVNSRESLFVHAGVVGWKGQAIVIPGRSFSGKTTLVEAFLRAGATYYSDEFAVLDDAGRVHAYPRALGIRKENMQSRITASEMGCRTGVEPLPLGMVLLTSYRPGATWRPKTASPGTATLSLLANSFAARIDPKRSLEAFGKAVAPAKVFQGARGEAKVVVDSVMQSMQAISDKTQPTHRGTHAKSDPGPGYTETKDRACPAIGK